MFWAGHRRLDAHTTNHHHRSSIYRQISDLKTSIVISTNLTDNRSINITLTIKVHSLPVNHVFRIALMMLDDYFSICMKSLKHNIFN